MIRPRWFVAVDRQTISRYAHLFETGGSSGGDARTACGVLPFDRMDPGSLGFSVPDQEDERCPRCLAMEVSVEQEAEVRVQ